MAYRTSRQQSTFLLASVLLGVASLATSIGCSPSVSGGDGGAATTGGSRESPAGNCGPGMFEIDALPPDETISTDVATSACEALPEGCREDATCGCLIAHVFEEAATKSQCQEPFGEPRCSDEGGSLIYTCLGY